jgi:asparagine synthase (glutamine-hydrolysing)
MSKKTNLLSFIKLGAIDIRLMYLVWDLKHSKRTFLSYSTLFSLASNYLSLKKKAAQAFHVAEFGVGRGGSAIFLAWLVNKYKGKLTLYDIFGRIPSPSEIDGDRAINRYEEIMHKESEAYYGNISNLVDVISAELSEVCPLQQIEIVKGKYENVLPNSMDKNVFSLVHIDCDWYESSKAVYNYLKSRLKPGAIIQVDDYSNWEGSKRAFQEVDWLSKFHTHFVDGALVIDTSRTI